MPIFEYECLTCGNVSEYLVLGDHDIETCRACGAQTLKKLMSPSARYSGLASKGLSKDDATGCCGSKIGHSANCAGPGSCCGKI